MQDGYCFAVVSPIVSSVVHLSVKLPRNFLSLLFPLDFIHTRSMTSGRPRYGIEWMMLVGQAHFCDIGVEGQQISDLLGVVHGGTEGGGEIRTRPL